MNRRPYHRRYHSDALTGYMSLTLEERGAYTTILDMLYDCWEPVVDNERYLAGCMGCSVRKYRSVRDALIEKGKIYLTDDNRISNSRFEKERENDAKFSRKQSENGSKRKDKSAESAEKPNKNNGASEPNANPCASSTSTSTSTVKGKKETDVSKKTATRSKPKTEIPDGWFPETTGVEYANDRGLTDSEMYDEIENFADYHKKHASKMADWSAAWRTWVRKAVEIRQDRMDRNNRSGGRAWH